MASVRNVCHGEKSALSAAYLKLVEQEEQTNSGHPRRIFAIDVGRCIRLSRQEVLTKKLLWRKNPMSHALFWADVFQQDSKLREIDNLK